MGNKNFSRSRLSIFYDSKTYATLSKIWNFQIIYDRSLREQKAPEVFIMRLSCVDTCDYWFWRHFVLLTTCHKLFGSSKSVTALHYFSDRLYRKFYIYIEFLSALSFIKFYIQNILINSVLDVTYAFANHFKCTKNA